MSVQESFTCPICQHPGKQPIYHNQVFLAKSPETELILTGKFNHFECSNCGANRQIQAPLVYLDPYNKLLFLLIPSFSSEKAEHQKKINQLLLLVEDEIDPYEIRIISNQHGLREKISIFQNNFTDTEIELLKLLTDAIFQQSYPDEDVINRYFHVDDQSIPKIIYICENQEISLDFPHALVPLVRKKYKKLLSEKHLGKLRIIDTNWANKAIQHIEMDSILSLE